MRMKITWSAEHRRSVSTICTAPAQDCKRSENPISYLYIQHHRYDIYRYHKNRQIIVINELKFRTVVLHSHGTSVSYIGLKSVSLLLVQPLNATSLRFTLLCYVITSKVAVLCGYWNLMIRSDPKNFSSIRIRSWSEKYAQNIIRSWSENAKPSSYQSAVTITLSCHICWIWK